MREYDTTFVIQPEISEDAREALIQKFGGVLEQAGGVALEVDDMGKRKLAYEIRKFQKGHYLSLLFLDEGGAVTELERAMRLEESVLRYLTVRKEGEVDDVEGRKARGVEAERIRKERAAERAEREAEERAAREAARITAEAEAQARAEAAGEAEAAQSAPAVEDEDDAELSEPPPQPGDGEEDEPTDRASADGE